MTQEEYEKLMKEIRYSRQMQRKRLYEQAKRANKKEGRCGRKQRETK
jgi:hypothetical protein